MKKLKLDKEESVILKSFEKGEWKPAKNLKRETMEHQQYARNTLKKDRRVNIRISSKDIERLQTFAIEDGIPYQTLMSSILHRFVTGRLVETKR